MATVPNRSCCVVALFTTKSEVLKFSNIIIQLFFVFFLNFCQFFFFSSCIFGGVAGLFYLLDRLTLLSLKNVPLNP